MLNEYVSEREMDHVNKVGALEGKFFNAEVQKIESARDSLCQAGVIALWPMAARV